MIYRVWNAGEELRFYADNRTREISRVWDFSACPQRMEAYASSMCSYRDKKAGIRGKSTHCWEQARLHQMSFMSTEMTLSHFSEKAERCSAQEHGMFLSEWIWQYSGVSVCMKGIHAQYSMACSKLCPVSLKRCFCWLNLLFRLLRKMSKAKTDTSELLV